MKGISKGISKPAVENIATCACKIDADAYVRAPLLKGSLLNVMYSVFGCAASPIDATHIITSKKFKKKKR
jgi:hypothetical protein